MKNIIDKINCNFCSKIYTGETGRCASLRMKEHSDMSNATSAVVLHFRENHTTATDISFTWQAIHTGLPWTNQRGTLESLYI